mmetsp:Transcript_7165/g.25965  ORF Transcript_7165/g.25965 Transcript_7165/m.25965 type:complete len:246 (-) Transcript_7165:111-848(-)
MSWGLPDEETFINGNPSPLLGTTMRTKTKKIKPSLDQAVPSILSTLPIALRLLQPAVPPQVLPVRLWRPRVPLDVKVLEQRDGLSREQALPAIEAKRRGPVPAAALPAPVGRHRVDRAAPPELVVRAPVVYRPNAHERERARAHDARLARHVEVDLVPEPRHGLPRLALFRVLGEPNEDAVDGLHLTVPGPVPRLVRPVLPLPDHLATPHQNASHGNLPDLVGLLRLRQRQPHETALAVREQGVF